MFIKSVMIYILFSELLNHNAESTNNKIDKFKRNNISDNKNNNIKKNTIVPLLICSPKMHFDIITYNDFKCKVSNIDNIRSNIYIDSACISACSNTLSFYGRIKNTIIYSNVEEINDNSLNGTLKYTIVYTPFKAVTKIDCSKFMLFNKNAMHVMKFNNCTDISDKIISPAIKIHIKKIKICNNIIDCNYIPLKSKSLIFKNEYLIKNIKILTDITISIDITEDRIIY